MRPRTITVKPVRHSQPSTPAPVTGKGKTSLRILFLVSAHNGLSQRAWIALRELGHEVEVAVVDSAAAMEAAVGEHDPELIVCPFLKTLIPEAIWRRHRCLVVHPGPRGDRGPSSLDWAIELGVAEWGVTVLLANGEFDAGEVLGDAQLPDARGGKGEPVPARGPARRDRGAARGGRADPRRRASRDDRRARRRRSAARGR